MFKRVSKTLTETLQADGELDLGFADKVTLADTGHRVFVGNTRYDHPRDFSISVDGAGQCTLTWLSDATVVPGTMVLIALAMIDRISAQDAGTSTAAIRSPTTPTDPLVGVAGGTYVFSANADGWSSSQAVSIQYLLPKADPGDPDVWVIATGPNGAATLTAPGALLVVLGNGATIRVTNASNLVDLTWVLA